jgi:uncharacterized membrane protein
MLSLSYFFSKKDTDQTEFANKLSVHCKKYDLVFVDFCIDEEPELENKYQNKTPAVCIGPYVLYTPFSETDLEIATKSALERHDRLNDEKDDKFKERIKNGVTINNLDRFSFFFSKYYVLMISLIIAIFVSIPFLAPVLEVKGHPGAANVIYKVYRVICHQLAFRSFYLFGEQSYYPRELAHIEGLTTYESLTGSSTIDINFARDFIGNELAGFKVAICERDVAIYGSLFLFGLFFHFTGKKIKQLPWFLWIVLALIPIAVDGLTQIPSLSSGWPQWIPIRESTPFLRILTGLLFGAGTGWYMYPMMEEGMNETRITLHRKFAIIKKINQIKT